MAEHDTQAGPAGDPGDRGYGLRLPVQEPDSHAESEMSLILDVLAECAETFGTERARFIRRIAAGDWHVHSLQHGSLVTHSADHAEVAMAWMVGLSRFPMRVTRPRVTQPDGTGVRPIAVTSYLGIPVLCRDHFVGVIELAGSIKGDLERTMERLSKDLSQFGERLTHDPALRAPQSIDLEAECWIDGGFWCTGDISLTADEWTLLSAIGEHRRLRDIAASVSFPEDHHFSVMRRLVSRGIASIRVATRVLVDDRESFRVESWAAADGGE